MHRSRHHSPRRPQALRGAALTALLTGVLAVAVPGSATAATAIVQAEAYSAQSGVQLEATADSGGGQNAAYLANGDWMRYDGVDLGAAGPLTVAARVSSAIGSGSVELHTGSATGPLLTQFPITATGGWQNWVTRTATAATHPTGAQTVFAVMKNTGAGDFVNINWFSFGGDGSGGGHTGHRTRYAARISRHGVRKPGGALSPRRESPAGDRDVADRGGVHVRLLARPHRPADAAEPADADVGVAGRLGGDRGRGGCCARLHVVMQSQKVTRS